MYHGVHDEKTVNVLMWLKLEVKTHGVCVLDVSFILVLLLIVFDWLFESLFRLWLTAVCYWFVNAVAGAETLIRPDAFSVPAVHGVWEEWSPWSLCSFTCGRGHRTRTRMCAPPQHGGRACDGPETQTKLCNIALCPGIICLLSVYYQAPNFTTNQSHFQKSIL